MSRNQKQIIMLVGGGHTHALLLAYLARHPQHARNVVLITPSRWQYYSGMMPGLLAGYYSLEHCRVDLQQLAEKAEVALVFGLVNHIDTEAKRVVLEDGRYFEFDRLSLDVGSQTEQRDLQAMAENLVPVKPLDYFYVTWHNLFRHKPPKRVVVAGGGAASVELSLALAQQSRASGYSPEIYQFTGKSGLLAHFPQRARQLAEHFLQEADIQLKPAYAQAIGPQQLTLSPGTFDCDVVIAATGAAAPVWLRASGLQLDTRGFVSVDHYHRSVSHPDIFAVGDVSSRTDIRLHRCGVHAVKVAPYLFNNLFEPDLELFKPYLPKRNQLFILSTTDKKAIACWGSMVAHGRWAWRWKDSIDRRFIRRLS